MKQIFVTSLLIVIFCSFSFPQTQPLPEKALGHGEPLDIDTCFRDGTRYRIITFDDGFFYEIIENFHGIEPDIFLDDFYPTNEAIVHVEFLSDCEDVLICFDNYEKRIVECYIMDLSNLFTIVSHTAVSDESYVDILNPDNYRTDGAIKKPLRKLKGFVPGPNLDIDPVDLDPEIPGEDHVLVVNSNVIVLYDFEGNFEFWIPDDFGCNFAGGSISTNPEGERILCVECIPNLNSPFVFHYVPLDKEDEVRRVSYNFNDAIDTENGERVLEVASLGDLQDNLDTAFLFSVGLGITNQGKLLIQPEFQDSSGEIQFEEIPSFDPTKEIIDNVLIEGNTIATSILEITPENAGAFNYPRISTSYIVETALGNLSDDGSLEVDFTITPGSDKLLLSQPRQDFFTGDLAFPVAGKLDYFTDEDGTDRLNYLIGGRLYEINDGIETTDDSIERLDDAFDYEPLKLINDRYRYLGDTPFDILYDEFTATPDEDFIQDNVTVSDDQQKIALASQDGEILVNNSGDEEFIQLEPARPDTILDVEKMNFSPQGSFLYTRTEVENSETGYSGDEIKVFNVDTNELEWEINTLDAGVDQFGFPLVRYSDFFVPNQSESLAVEIAPRGLPYAVQFYDAQSGDITNTLGPLDKSVRDLSFFQNDQKAAVLTDDSVDFWDLQNNELEKSYPVVSGFPRNITILPEQNMYGLGGVRDINFFDLNTGESLGALEAHTINNELIGTLEDPFRFVTGGEHSIKIWDLEFPEPQQLKTNLLGLEGTLHSAALSLNQNRLATIGDAGLYLWDYEQLEIIRHIAGQHSFQPNNLGHVVFSDDGQFLISSTENSQYAKLYSSDNGDFLMAFLASNNILEISPNNNYIATTGSNQDVQVWNTMTGELHWKSKANDDVMSFDFTPDETQLLSGDESGEVIIWDVNTGETVNTYQTIQNNFETISKLKVSSDGSEFLVGSSGGNINIITKDTGELVQELSGTSGDIKDILWLEDEFRIFTINESGKIRGWNTETGESVLNQNYGFDFGVFEINGSFSDDGSTAFIVDVSNQLIQVPLDQPENDQVINIHNNPIQQMAIFPNDEKIALGYDQKSSELPVIEIYDLNTNQLIQNQFDNIGNIIDLMFSPNNEDIGYVREFFDESTGAPSTDGIIANSVTGETKFSINEADVMYSSIEFSPDGSQILTVGNRLGVGYGSILNAEDGRLIQSFEDDSIIRADFSDGIFLPDGEHVLIAEYDPVVSSEGQISLWNIATGNLVTTYPHPHNTLTTIDLSPGGNLLATSSETNGQTIYDLSTREVIHTISSFNAPESDIQFSPDGQYFGTSAGIYSTEYGVQQLSVSHTKEISDIVFDQNNSLITGGLDGLVIKWNLPKAITSVIEQETKIKNWVAH